MCEEIFRENGEGRFSDRLLHHFSTQHLKEWNRLKELNRQADEELSKLKEKYPELHLSFGAFTITKQRMYNPISN
jgi:recombinational DNA repair ATPase RecF